MRCRVSERRLPASLSGTLFDLLTKRAASRREHMAVPFFVGTPSTKRTL